MNLPRRDAPDKLRGRTRYTIDRIGPDMLHAALLRSDVASARIIGIDLSDALKMPGVKAIATYRDAPFNHGNGIADQPAFAHDLIRYHGEPIAAVAATTKKQAEDAVAAIKLELEPLDPVLTMAEALAPGARLIHPDWETYEVLVEGAKRKGNIGWEATVVRGDTDAAFARDDVTIVEGVFEVGRQSHVPFEPRVAIASYEDGRIHVETSTQVPWTVRHVVARTLGIPDASVRVTVPPVGGGFGLKFDTVLEPYVAILAKKSGRTVALANSRREDQMTCLCRENAELRIRSAVTRDGRIVGREATVLMDAGAYGGEQAFLTTMTAHTLGGNYKVDAIKLNSQAIYTNTVPNGAFRACNGVYNTFFLERHTDEICKKIGMDPAEFRRKNAIGHGDLGATGQVFEGDVLGPMLDRCTQKFGAAPQSGRLPDGRLYGKATTMGTWFIFVSPSSATVNLNSDGSATLVTSGVEIGQGTMVQALPQIVAANLGLHPDDVIVKSADTDGAGRDVGVGGGRTTVSIGAASTAACNVVRDQLLDVASEMLQTPKSRLELAEGEIRVSEGAGPSVSLKSVIAQAEMATGPISGSGAFTNPGVPSLAGCAAGHMIDAIDLPVFAVHDCEVAVDPATGHVEVLSYNVVQDVGRALNPRAVQSQIQGGVVQGLGYALHEEITIGADGAFDQQGFETYRIPGAMDVLPIQTELYEGAPSLGPMGVKGAGEVPILNVPATVACAVANATGKNVNSLPLTPPRVLALLEDQSSLDDLPHVSFNWAANTLRFS
jgi:CO/xanthine dehydrogenase Mo-binding subunit